MPIGGTNLLVADFGAFFASQAGLLVNNATIALDLPNPLPGLAKAPRDDSAP